MEPELKANRALNLVPKTEGAAGNELSSAGTLPMKIEHRTAYGKREVQQVKNSLPRV